MYGVAFSNSPFASQSEIAIVVSSVSATSSAGAITVTGDCNISLTGVAGTSAVGTPTIIEGTGVSLTLTGVASTGAIDSLVVSANSNLTATGVSGASTLGDVTITAAATIVNISIPGLVASTNVVSIVEPSSNNFDYESIKDSYDRTRVVYINETSQRFTVFIPPDLKNRTIHIAPLDRDNTIRIAA